MDPESQNRDCKMKMHTTAWTSTRAMVQCRDCSGGVSLFVDADIVGESTG
jgi:hypothetical protein